jgi:hypothetical protein
MCARTLKKTKGNSDQGGRVRTNLTAQKEKTVGRQRWQRLALCAGLSLWPQDKSEARSTHKRRTAASPIIVLKVLPRSSRCSGELPRFAGGTIETCRGVAAVLLMPAGARTRSHTRLLTSFFFEFYYFAEYSLS